MKVDKKFVTLLGICLVGALLMEHLLYKVVGACRMTDTPHQAAPSPEMERPHLHQETKEFDLGDGMKVVEIVSKSASGDIWLRATTISRNGQKLLMKHWDRLAGNKHLDQFVFQKGKLFMCEIDEDGDGVFDLLVLYDDTELLTQAFQAKENGVLLQLSSDHIKKMRDDWKSGTEIVTPLVEGARAGVSKEEREQLIRGAIEKAKEQERAKHLGESGDMNRL